jgi:hypothetical protein
MQVGTSTSLARLEDNVGDAVAQLVEALRYKAEGRWFDSQCCHTSKGCQCVGLTTLPPSRAECLHIRSLNFLEIPGPIQVCTGTALPHHEDIQEKQMYSSTQIRWAVNFTLRLIYCPKRNALLL